MKFFLDIERIRTVKDLLHQLSQKDQQSKRQEFDQHIRALSRENIILLLHEIKQDDPTIKWEMIQDFYAEYYSLYKTEIDDISMTDSKIKSHPVEIFKQENQCFFQLLKQLREQLINPILNTGQLQVSMEQLGKIYRHYNRKEKLFFPILERYGVLNPLRLMWADDDRVRTLYKGTKSMIDKLPDIDMSYVNNAFSHFEKACQDVIFQETYFLLPLAKAMLQEEDWFAVARESRSFGYAVETPDYEELEIPEDDKATDHTEHLRIGNGFLTINEADHILNHLPLEITFVDKNGLFKYFNDVVEASEMMFIRTPSSIGRHVANCHPPKGLKKVMKVIRDLKSKKRSSETMWFKKGDQFIHVTYQALFDENDEYLGILEYVQDIQPFSDLPRAIKKEVSSYNK